MYHLVYAFCQDLGSSLVLVVCDLISIGHQISCNSILGKVHNQVL